MTFKYHHDRATPTNGEIFVFGSNLAGIHGAGAAREAFMNFGAVKGNGIGLSDNSYAIPTKDKNIKTMPLYNIIPYIELFAKFTHDNPKMRFMVTRVGCGLAGYTDDVIAPMFKECNSNCSFADSWKPYLQ